MARCGCSGSGSSTCDAIVRCLAGNLGAGLMYTGGRIQVRISRDGGNCIRFGSDQGIYSQCAAIPPDQGGKTIEGLPDDVFVGTNGGAALLQTFASPQAIEYAVANRVDIIDCTSYRLMDNVAAWGPMTGTRSIDYYTSNPSTEGGRDMTSEQWVNLQSDAGTPGINPTGRNSTAPASLITPDGGWYGWYQPPHRLLTTAEALKLVAGRACVILQHSHEGNYDVRANANAILSLQAQAWAMPAVGTTALSSVATYLNFGIQHVCVNVSANTTITPAQVLASGATWVKLRETQTNARIQEFVNSGLQVLTGYSGRQTTGQQMLNLGVRGLMSGDPVYQRGIMGGEWLDYRTYKIALITRMTELGMLTGVTDDGFVERAVGYPKADETGRFFSSQWGWNGSNARQTNTQLLGKFCPLRNANNYRLEMSCKVNQGSLPTGTGPKLGWLIASDNDLDPSWVSPETVPVTRHGYACFIRVGTASTGELVIVGFDGSGVATQLAAANTGAVTANSWINLSVEVTPTTITLKRLNGTLGQVSVTHSSWRGPYVFHLWEDVVGGSGQAFVHGYRDNKFIDTVGAGTVWDQLTSIYPTWGEMAEANPTWQQLSEVSV